MADGTSTDPLSMSLDDVIAKSRSNSTRPQNARRGRGSSSSRPARGRGRGRGGDILVQVQNSGGIRKPVGNRRGLFREEADESSHTKHQKLEGNMRWSHDRGPQDSAWSRHRPTVVLPAPAAARAPKSTAKLIVSNLDQNVSDEDIKELFGSQGQLKQCAINYNREGRSQGTANVEFVKTSDADKAVKEFNGVHLDGKPMQIHQIMEDGPASDIRSRLSPATAPSRGGGLFDRALASVGQETLAATRRGRGDHGAAMDMS